ncbi:hypothetical protein, partial [Prevotella melaninogenica]
RRVRLLVDLVDKYLSIQVKKLTVIKEIKEPLVRFLLVLTALRSLEFKAHIKVQVLILHFAVFTAQDL